MSIILTDKMGNCQLALIKIIAEINFYQRTIQIYTLSISVLYFDKIAAMPKRQRGEAGAKAPARLA